MKNLIQRLFRVELPVPLFLRPVIKLFYLIGVAVAEGWRGLYGKLIAGPVLKSIADVGRGLRIERVPYVRGPGKVTVGDDVYISGKINISFSRHSDEPPELSVGNRSFIGHGCSFSMARKISIGDDCLISGGVFIQDNDGHPQDLDERKAGKPVDIDNISPVVMEDGAWIGRGAVILKGVTVGKGAIVGAGSIVVSDVPADSVAVGNPARVVKEIQRQA